MAAAFVALHLALVACWWRWLTPRAAGLTRAERLLCASVLSVAQVVGASLLLGWCGRLALGPLLAAILVTGAAATACRCSRGTGARGRRGASPGGVGAWHSRGSAAAAPSHVLRYTNLALVALLLPTLTLLVARGVLVPSFGWDGLKYHLPMSALMRQTGHLAFPPVHNPVIAAYPKSGEIWSHWILAFFGDDRWLGIAQLPFLLIAMLATYCAARRLRASRAAAATGMLLVPFAPVALTQVTVAYTDVILAALLLAAVALALAARAVPGFAVALSVGAALGLLLGTKFTALVYVALLFAVFAIAVLRAQGRSGLPALGLAALLALLLGGDTYVRNWRLHGNPVFPYRTTLLGQALPGPWDESQVYGIAQTRDLAPAARLLRSWSAVGVVSHSELFGGFGAMAPLLVVVFAASLVVAARERDVAWLALLALFAALFALTPLSFRARFVLYLLGGAGICLSRLLDQAAPRGRTALLAAVLAVAVVTTAQIWRLELPALLAAGAERGDPCREAQAPAFRPAYRWLRAHAPAGSTVLAFAGPEEVFPYCLWTPSFANRVEFAAAATAADLERLAAAPADAILFLPHRSPAYGSFAASDPARWRTLFADDAVTVAAPAREGAR